MGAEISQDKPSEPSANGPSNNTQSSHTTNPEANQKTKEVALPHNYEGILKHANSPVDRSSPSKILEQLHAGVFLNQNKKKYWVEKGSNRNCFFLYARDLSITWADDSRLWRWPLLQESSDEAIEVAELLDVCWLELHGKFELSNLSPETIYEIVFVLKLKDPAYGWELPVNVRLTLPDGSKQEHKENLLEKPRGKWLEITAGEFRSSPEKLGEIEFSIYEYEGGIWKRGLLVKGVSIRPKGSIV
ncbi:Protein PHLOEM PROTEIN 2-LIKE A1 [Striga hermonthica]|uniref:Protein PHLOEM PROTEIN 2-LIKE A1 n=1 Tax=Striga hermonthica TaxID=68872 RepID=A0A9N7NDE2_STRHE|nr:Protein PHLOEM PROTEIN 2-LIKE A1 [Striga hermonthica]